MKINKILVCCILTLAFLFITGFFTIKMDASPNQSKLNSTKLKEKNLQQYRISFELFQR